MDLSVKVFAAVLALAFFVVIGLCILLLPLRKSELGQIENIHGIPFPQENSAIYITEKLAHFDVYLNKSVVGKKLQLTITLEPGNTNELWVGVRENSFWLSYPWQPIFKRPNASSTNQHTAVLEIPLTDKLQNTDQSIDVMMLAGHPNELIAPEDEILTEKVNWKLLQLEVKVKHTWPTLAELKNYLTSIVYWERPA